MEIQARFNVRRCAVCRKRKPPTLEYFYQRKATNSGLSAWCKVCSLLKSRVRYRAIKTHLPMSNGQKKCRLCMRLKSLIEFSACRASRDGRKNICRKCDQNGGKARRLKNRWGMTIEDFNRMVVEQDAQCLICQRPFDLRLGRKNVMTPRVDHDHKSGKIRGLLCQPCNSALGFLNDSVDRCLGVISYLKNKCGR